MVGKEELIKSLTELLENEDVEAIQQKVAELKEHYEALLIKSSSESDMEGESKAEDPPEQGEEETVTVEERAAAPTEVEAVEKPEATAAVPETPDKIEVVQEAIADVKDPASPEEVAAEEVVVAESIEAKTEEVKADETSEISSESPVPVKEKDEEDKPTEKPIVAEKESVATVEEVSDPTTEKTSVSDESPSKSEKPAELQDEPTSADATVDEPAAAKALSGKPAAANALSGKPAAANAPSGEHVAIESAELQDENDKQFKLLLDEFNKRRNDLRKKRAEEVKQNLEKARGVIESLKKLNSEEENISRSFNKLNDLKAEWKAIGNVPKDQYRELQHEYSQELDVFFYNINIYKELRENDLKRNSGLKQALISDVQALSEEKNIRVLDQKLREYQEQWHQIGPTLKEEWEALRDQFWTGVREAYQRIHEHFQKRREEQEGHLKAKQAIVATITAINEKEIKDHKVWRKVTEDVLEAQGNWRKIGFATKKDNDRIWKEFRSACDAFFAKKREFYDVLKGSNEESKAAKEKLIEQAEALKESTEWRDATDKFKALQKQWQSVGTAAPKDDQRLWRKFRSACDHFFNTKKKHFASQDEQQAADLKLKEALLKKIEGHKHSGKKQEDLAAIKAFQAEWKAIGHVPMKHKERVNNTYFKMLDGLFSALDMDQQEKAKIRFQGKLDSMSGGPNAGRSIQKEQQYVRGKKQELEGELLQLENNMTMFFKHADDSNPLVREANKKLDKVRREIQKLVEQEKLLRQHAKQVQ